MFIIYFHNIRGTPSHLLRPTVWESLLYIVYIPHPLRYPYFAWSHDPESYAGGSVAAGRSPIPDRSKVMFQTKRDTLARHVGGWAWGWRPHPLRSFNCWETFKACSSNRKSGQGSSWTLAPQEEDILCIYKFCKRQMKWRNFGLP
jgi:hypothetical protein